MDKWTREETIIAFNLYCKIPFKSSSKTHPLVVKYAQIIGRSASALNMKIGNIGRLDPDLKSKGITGLTHGGKVEQEVWNEFYGNPEMLAYESERLIAELSGKSIEETTHIQIEDLPEGKEREVVVRQRVNQSLFRATVMNAYNFRCCISGVKKPELVDACHIVDWAVDTANRTNPKNGLCLNPFFHKAYDKWLISITPDFEIVVSEKLLQSTESEATQDYLSQVNGTKIHLPNFFLPQRELLEIHHNQYLSRQ
ncbi:MAG: HNH endonuclease [Muribaculaceae bacterium]